MRKIIILFKTRSLGALRTQTSSWRPFGRSGLWPTTQCCSDWIVRYLTEKSKAFHQEIQKFHQEITKIIEKSKNGINKSKTFHQQTITISQTNKKKPPTNKKNHRQTQKTNRQKIKKITKKSNKKRVKKGNFWSMRHNSTRSGFLGLVKPHFSCILKFWVFFGHP